MSIKKIILVSLKLNLLPHFLKIEEIYFNPMTQLISINL